jgi:hypothetical protein
VIAVFTVSGFVTIDSEAFGAKQMAGSILVIGGNIGSSREDEGYCGAMGKEFSIELFEVILGEAVIGLAMFDSCPTSSTTGSTVHDREGVLGFIGGEIIRVN